MRYRIPRLVDGLSIRPVTDSAPPAYFLENVATQKRIQLPAALIMMLFMTDGQTTVEKIEARAERFGLEPPDGVFERLLTALLDAGFAEDVDVRELEQRVLPGTEHVCEGCGRSCEGHLIGPLPKSEVETVLGLKDALAERVERLAGEPLVVRLPERPGMYLQMVKGRCIFLDPDKRCAIHRHFGAASKPSICRSFPVVRVFTEDGARVGVSPACFRHHMHMERSLGDPVETTAVESGSETLLDLPSLTKDASPFYVAPLDRDPERLAAAEGFTGMETTVIGYLGREDARLDGLVALLESGEVPDESHTDALVVDSEAMSEARAILARFRDGLDLRSLFIGYLAAQEGGLADAARALLADVDALVDEEVRLAPWTVPAPMEQLLLDRLRRIFWLRDALEFQSPLDAVGAMTLGLILARIGAAREQAEGASNGDGDAHDAIDQDAIYDTVAERLVAWYRVLLEDNLDRAILRAGDARALLSHL